MQLCKDHDGKNIRVGAALSNVDPKFEDDGIILFSSENDNVAFLIRGGQDDQIEIFNAGGGIRLHRDGSVEVLTPDGTLSQPNMDESLSVDSQDNSFCLTFWPYLACRIGGAPGVFQ